MQTKINKLLKSDVFAIVVTSVIIVNAILVGLELTFNNSLIAAIQNFCIFFFVTEIVFRWIGKDSIFEYLKNGWNWFDIIIVGISLVPANCFQETGLVSAFRVLRVFRVLRLLKAFPNIGLMARVLLKSVSSLIQAIAFLLIFMYLYALIGVILFKGEIFVSNFEGAQIDPFGNIGEAIFSLFRVTTGEDWTDLRYDLINSSRSNWIVNLYYVSWMILSAFLLLNVIIGAIVNNYDLEYNKAREDEQDSKLDRILKQIEEINKKFK